MRQRLIIAAAIHHIADAIILEVCAIIFCVGYTLLYHIWLRTENSIQDEGFISSYSNTVIKLRKLFKCYQSAIPITITNLNRLITTNLQSQFESSNVKFQWIDYHQFQYIDHHQSQSANQPIPISQSADFQFCSSWKFQIP